VLLGKRRYEQLAYFVRSGRPRRGVGVRDVRNIFTVTEGEHERTTHGALLCEQVDALRVAVP
jgi:hypothetical protein